MKKIQQYGYGLVMCVLLAIAANSLATFIPYHLISGSVVALLLGMVLNPYLVKTNKFQSGINYVSKRILRLSIILMGLTLSFTQVVSVGRVSLIVMSFTLFTAFTGGYLLGKLFKMDWRLSALISSGTGICGGSAVAAIAPVIKAKDRDIAYAIAATFIFDIVMVILFPIMGQYFAMSDLGYGLWAGTAVNDTSSVVAAAYAYSDGAGAYAVIVKLTRTLAIIPTVLCFSFINARLKAKNELKNYKEVKVQKVSIKKIFPYFIILFLVMVMIKSTGFISADLSANVSTLSKFMMVMALGAIGLKTNIKEMSYAGYKPLLHGLLISTLVVIVSFLVQMALGLL